MKTYTAFCTDANDYKSTTWIEDIEVDDSLTLQEAAHIARQQCADAWEYDIDDVHCLGLAEGSINILFWEDVSR